MTALWCDGFEGYYLLEQKYENVYYTAIGVGLNNGRYGRQGLYFTGAGMIVGDLTKNVPDSDTLIAGIAWNGHEKSGKTSDPASLSRDHIIAFKTAGTLQVAVSVMDDGTLAVHNNTTILGRSFNTITYGDWYYIELKSSFGSSGQFKVRVTSGTEDSTWIDGAGNTDTSGSGIGNQVSLSSECNPDISDYYIVNTSGSVNNNFLGDSRVLSVMPLSDGTYRQWTPSSGSDHFSLINEFPPSDLEYVSTLTNTNIDTYHMTKLDSALREAHFMQQCFYVSESSGFPSLTPAAYVNSALYYNAPITSLPATAGYVFSIWERRPDSGTTWTGNSINNNEFGIS